MKINVLAFGAHPDDVELGAGGILATHAMRGLTTGIVDLSKGEMGTRGTPELRDEEAKDAAAILGCSVRLNLEMPDGRIDYSHESQLEVVRVLRKYQPDIVLMNAPTDRHPDHGRASRLVEEACFLSGLHKIVIKDFNFDTLATQVYRLASDERLAEASGAALLIVILGVLPVVLLQRAKAVGNVAD